MKRFSFFLIPAIGLFATALFLNSCQKDNLQSINPNQANLASTDRGPNTDVYGVSVFRPGTPSQLITMNIAGTVTNNVPVYILDANNNQVFLDDLKGVCIYGDQVWVTTGPHPVDAYSNLLIKVNPVTGQGGIISHSTVGTVSDIDYDPIADAVYGLLNNNNRLVKITDNGNNWGTYVVVGNITNLGANYTAQGLSIGKDINSAVGIFVAATKGIGGNAQLYREPATAGAATFLAVINPAVDLASANCGIGYQNSVPSMVINRQPGSGAGANSFAWTIPVTNPSASAFWGGLGWNFDDFSTGI